MSAKFDTNKIGDYILKNISSLERLIMDIQDISKIEGERFKLNIEKVDFQADGKVYRSGKAVTVVVREVLTGNLEAGSFMVEATSLTSIEGLLSMNPQMKNDLSKALTSIESVQGSLATGGDVGRALSTLQKSLDDLPSILAEEVFSE